jgi:cellobiose phosphorylase
MQTATTPPSAESTPTSRPTAVLLPDLGGGGPIRAELYGLEALEVHARSLAAASPSTTAGRAEGPLLPRLEKNARALAEAYRQINAAAAREETLTPDAEWLLDNYYIIDEVLREVRHDLPRGYYRKLPKLTDGPLAGYPRIYPLALSLIAHTDSGLDEAHIRRFVQAYQEVAPLTIGELWAVPTMLRLGLIENLRRLADQMLAAWTERRRAEVWLAQRGSGLLPPLPAGAPLTDAFVVRALHTLRDVGPPAAFEALKLLLAERGLDAAEVVRRENQRQAVNQVSVGNCVTSLRLLAALDWAVFFEHTNLVDPLLRQDPAGVYEGQDFATRDRYRQAVEKLARRSRFTEVETARRVLKLARQGQQAKAAGQTDRPVDHVGYYLIGPGLRTLRAEVGYRPAPMERLRDALLHHPHAYYFGTILFLTAGLLVLTGALAAAGGAGPGLIALAVLAALLPASELAVGLVNYGTTLFLPPRVLPKLDFREGIPADCATFVVMPSLLVRPESAAVLLEKLEVHYLANPDPQLRFALLTDFADAPTETRPEDEGYLRAALEGVQALNRRYAGDGPPKFYLFHRARQWNPSQGCWMGWERKRGKLSEFNRLLRGDRRTSYTVCSSDPAKLPRIRYVITLDVDTQLPRETARRLIGALAHPLNRPRYDPQQGRVVEGYGVLQPRVSFHIPAANRSRFSRIWAASAGIDPYATAVSDIYQDLFGAGSFTGKGIYEVDAFEAATGHAFPDNHILSHDLIEGNFARCGLVTDLELFDDFPSHYLSYARREHRWVRGDWQLLPWLGRRCPVRPDAATMASGLAASGQRTPADAGRSPASFVMGRAWRPNPLPILERWKVLDNLRRSLVPPALVFWLVLSWTVLPLPLTAASILALAVLTLPVWLQTLGALVGFCRSGKVLVLHEYFCNVPATLGQVTLATVFLLHQALLSLDAIGRTLYRLFVSRRHLLEWETAATTERRLRGDLKQTLLDMLPAVGVALGLAGLVSLARPEALTAAVPFVFAWVLAPLVAFLVSQPLPAKGPVLTEAERLALRRVARKTWGFFETFVSEEDNWLPPDNFQEEPRPQIAARTSPTNKGLLLLSTLAAHDLGYLNWDGLLGRLENTFATLDRLERYRGHFYNWYDTRSLKPLQPAYVSTVDSGNFLACALTLKQGLAQKVQDAILGPQVIQGLNDTLALVAEAVAGVAADHPELAEVRRQAEALLAELGRQLQPVPADLLGWSRLLARLGPLADQLVAQGRTLAERAGPMPWQPYVWSERFAAAVRDRAAELARLAPWLELLETPEAGPWRPALEKSGVWRRLIAPFRLKDFEAGKETLLAELEALRSPAPEPDAETDAPARKDLPCSRSGLPHETAETDAPARKDLPCSRSGLPHETAETDAPARKDLPCSRSGLPHETAETDAPARKDLPCSRSGLPHETAETDAPARKDLPCSRSGLPHETAEPRGGFLAGLQQAVANSAAGELLERVQRLASRAEALAAGMDFRFLYKPDRHLFAVGYNVPLGRLDAACYDLLASEARLASFLAVARGDAPRRHWFHLGRMVTRVQGQLCLLSWGGTMFEYLMPELMLRRFPGTLLAESCQAAVAQQISYGRQRGVPWGISESAFSSQYVNLDYQYQAFGVPGLGLKRGLGQDLVVAPYATALAAMVRPREALANLRRLEALGAYSRYGFYESVDFTRSRLPEGKRYLVVRCFMAHHQGMSLVALANCLLDNLMPQRFHTEPMVRATELLLQERMPVAATPAEPPGQDHLPRAAVGPEGVGAVSRRLTTPFTAGPRGHLLSNGRYSVFLTNSGAGWSWCEGLDVTRWREDLTCDALGQFYYVRDLNTGKLWSAGHQPVGRLPESYEVLYSADKAEIRRLDGVIGTHLEIAVDPENRAEVRRITLSNHDHRPHELELTSYAEIVLAPHAADLAHPAFGKLFLETEWLPAHGALLCRRRPRSAEQTPIWAVHVVSGGAHGPSGPEFETDRARFLGRGRTPARPAALDRGAVLSGTTGPVLDPIFSLRRRIQVEPGESVTITFCTAVADSREEALALADHYRDPQASLRAFDLAWAHSQIELRHLRLSTEEAHLYQRLASHLLCTGPALRAPTPILAANRQGQSGLWRHGISGDRPILLVRIGEAEEMPLVRQLLAAHAYWRLKGLEADLVVLLEQPTSYFEELFQAVQEAVRASDAQALVDKPGGVFVRKADQMSAEDVTLLQAAARVVLVGYRGSLAAQLNRPEPVPELPAPLPAVRRANPATHGAPVRPPEGLLFPNGQGGFTPDGREYCILLQEFVPGGAGLALPPAPWINVLANPSAGCLVSESGLGCTWAFNSQQNRLTPWNNDPVSDPPAEVLYLRDENSGEVWTPTPRPLGGSAATLVRHGQGYTRFQRNSHGLAQDLLVFVPPQDSVKLLVLRLKNTGSRPRRLSATYYAEWVLGTVRDQAPLHVRTEVDAQEGALLAHNPFVTDHGRQVAFADVSARPRTLTGDRTEFLGRNGSLAAPAALRRVELSGRTGPGLDPCAALQAPFELAPGAEREIVFLLGSADDLDSARQLLRRYKEPGRAQRAFEQVRQLWDGILGAVQVHTPDPALDLLVNRWLPYQVLSCRLWGRSAFYQSGGAYGFRDQLQDVMALVYGAPQEARAHLLRAAARQFLEGDVQHWWHPPAGRGVRTRISDDYLWLPFVVCHYVAVTGDAAVLDERLPYLRMPHLQPGQEDEYGVPEVTAETGTLYEHCVRALENGLHFGEHGLPLMGAGDWNDGMNRVGAGGKGESVWNGWFLLACLECFAQVADGRGDLERAAFCRQQAGRLRQAIEESAWDGAWYRRAYFDDGTPLGSAQNEECQIDSIAQSWAVLAGGDTERARQAMRSVEERLVKERDRLILLLTPPFDQGPLQPGYIKGYVPGIRENGGQYTHAAAWVVLATAALGQGTRAWQLFDLLNPIRHGDTPDKVALYKVEPYVVAGDVYGAAPHTGRGGWSWYTGSAAWLYRVALEGLLGLRRQGPRLTVDPCIPKEWSGFEIGYRYQSATYRLRIENPAHLERGVRQVVLDGQDLAQHWFDLADDGQEHEVRIIMG